GAFSVMLLQPGTQRVSTLGSLSATHSASTGAGMVSLPPISSFTGASQTEQFLHHAAIDAGAFGRGERRLLDDLERREVADRERHVRAHHDSARPYDIGEVTQRAG